MHTRLVLGEFLCVLSMEVIDCACTGLRRKGRRGKGRINPQLMNNQVSSLKGIPMKILDDQRMHHRFHEWWQIAQPDIQPDCTSIFEHKFGSVSAEIFPLLRSTDCKAVLQCRPKKTTALFKNYQHCNCHRFPLEELRKKQTSPALHIFVTLDPFLSYTLLKIMPTTIHLHESMLGSTTLNTHTSSSTKSGEKKVLGFKTAI